MLLIVYAAQVILLMRFSPTADCRYRLLWLLFSSYMYANLLRRIDEP